MCVSRSHNHPLPCASPGMIRVGLAPYPDDHPPSLSQAANYHYHANSSSSSGHVSDNDSSTRALLLLTRTASAAAPSRHRG